MIELRWLVKEKAFTSNNCNYIETVNVLQYRTLGRLVSNGWSAWKDVPTVKKTVKEKK